MFSGPVSAMTAMIDAITERTERARMMDARPFARLCRQVYLEERKPLLESEILGEYDIEDYAEYMALRKVEPSFHQEIAKNIKEVEQYWSLLFAGFDKQRRAHIFTITECGKIRFYDRVGYAAIGSGEWQATLALSAYSFRKNLDFSKAVFGIAAAKFAAEGAEGVGQETILTVLEPRTKRAPVFSEIRVENLREMWAELPRFPGNEAIDEIWKELNMFQQAGWLTKNRAPKPSISEKLAVKT